MDEIIYRAKKIAYMYQEWKRLNKEIKELKCLIDGCQQETGHRKISLVEGKPNGYEYSEILAHWATPEEFESYLNRKRNEYKKAMTRKKDIEFRLSIWIKNGEAG